MARTMSYSENVKVALQSVKSNKLRTFLTAIIIAIGLTALVGILTSIDAIEGSLNNTFSSMGANSFTIRNRGTGIWFLIATRLHLKSPAEFGAFLLTVTHPE